MKRYLVWALFGALLTGCGSGGSAGGVIQQAPVGLALELGTEAAQATTVLYGVQATFRLPAGVTVASDPVSGELTAGELRPRIEGGMVSGRYLPAGGAEPARVRVSFADARGITVGPFAYLNCQTLSTTVVREADFVMEEFSVRDANGAPLPGIASRLTVSSR